jgi:hypothetical protein
VRFELRAFDGVEYMVYASAEAPACGGEVTSSHVPVTAAKATPPIRLALAPPAN